LPVNCYPLVQQGQSFLQAIRSVQNSHFVQSAGKALSLRRNEA
jgi:hypothetical protein